MPEIPGPNPEEIGISPEQVEQKEIIFQVENRSVFGFDWDHRVLMNLMAEQGINEEQAKSIKIILRDMQIPDYSIQGLYPSGGLCHENGDIELITSAISHERDYRVTRIPLSQETMARNLLHEIQHAIEILKGEEHQGTFHLNPEAHQQDPSEQKANAFAEKHLAEFLPHTKVYDRPEFSDTIEHRPVTASELTGLEQVQNELDTSRINTVIQKEDPVLQLWERKTAEMEGKKHGEMNPSLAQNLARQATALTETRRMSVPEFFQFVRILEIESGLSFEDFRKRIETQIK